MRRYVFVRSPANGVYVAHSPQYYQSLDVQVSELPRRQVQDLKRDPQIVGIAPTMPLNLIQPFEVHYGPARQAWGVGAVGADRSPYSGKHAIVALLDSGIDANHLAFVGHKLLQRDFTGEGDGDTHGNGTHCAATIFGQDVGATRIGIARGIDAALIGKIIGRTNGSTDALVRAIVWAAAAGANIIVMSVRLDVAEHVSNLVGVGIPAKVAFYVAIEDYRSTMQLLSALLAPGCANASEFSGFVTIAAAGNDAQRLLDDEWQVGVGPPALLDGVISVGALGNSEGGLTVADFSNAGVSLAAPGADILSAQANSMLCTRSGSTMAAAHAAGVAALWIEKLTLEGSFSRERLMRSLMNSARLDMLRSDITPTDVGRGIVRSPCNAELP